MMEQSGSGSNTPEQFTDRPDALRRDMPLHAKLNPTAEFFILVANRSRGKMGILIKAPTRRTDSGLQLATPPPNGDLRVSLHIREVVRITGLRREQLYMWQRRYGFPNPARDGF